MEYHLTKKTISRLRYAADTVTEQAVDVDLSLPDYCPDIEKILSCTLIPEVNMTNVSGDRLSIEGSSCVRVVYLDGDQSIRVYEYRTPFSESLPIKGEAPDHVVYVDAKPEYLNCRALSPRKLSLHGAFSLSVRVAVKDEQPYYAYDDGDELQTKSDTIAVSTLCGLSSERFSVQEDISVSGKSDINTLISHRLSARITDMKAIQNKIMLNAELKLDLMYLSGIEAPALECMTYSLPISRVVDCEGVDENAVIDGELSVMSSDVHLSDDALDGSSVLSLDAGLCLNTLCYASCEIEVLSDAFSTERDAQVQTEPFSCNSGILCRSFTDTGKATVALEEEIGKILDVHCEKLTASHTAADDGVMIHTRMTVGIYFENQENETRYVERDAEFSFCPDTEGFTDVLRMRAAVDSLSYRLKDDRQIELRAEMCYHLTVCKRLNCAAVTGVSAEDDAPKRSHDSTLILYYADDGDRVWNIAKQFCSRPADIIAENDLDGELIDAGMMLMIPTA